MKKVESMGLKSKAFRDGGLIRMMDFAIRGVHRHRLQGEQFVDRDWALGIYEEQLYLLDTLNIHSQWFTSGVIGAALITLKLYPQTIEFWRRLAKYELWRDERGSDAPGLLREIIQKHQNDKRLTRSQDYQMFLFQTSIALATAWNHHDDENHRYTKIPPVPDVIEMLAEIQNQEGERCSLTGFRKPATIRASWVLLEPPEIKHRKSSSEVGQLARLAAELEEDKPCENQLKRAVGWLEGVAVPEELAHPAAMAAAVVTVAQNKNAKELWLRVFNYLGCRKPAKGRKPIADASMSILDSIYEANRSNTPQKSAGVLYSRSRFLVKQWLERPNHHRKALPRVPKINPIDEIWRDVVVQFSPRVKFGLDKAAPKLVGELGQNEQKSSSAAPSKKAREAGRKRIRTGRLAEEWFRKNYTELAEEFFNSEIVDCRENQNGYDFHIETSEGARYVEVKALSMRGGSIRMTDRQWQKAKLEGDKYYLICIREPRKEEPEAFTIRNPAAVLEPIRRKIIRPVIEWQVRGAELEIAAARNPC